MPDLTHYYEPFDLMYEIVTRRIQDRASQMNETWQKRWLERLIRGFQDERSNWPATTPSPSSYDQYFENAYRLKWRFLKLTACAYMHIAYDLPRVLEREWQWWPFSPHLVGLPRGWIEEYEAAESIYFGLNDIFPAAFAEGARDHRVAGYPGVVISIVPKGVVSSACQWMMHLRTAAWLHGQRLSRSQNRALMEAKMMEAMNLALSQVTNLKPWNAGLLTPPNAAFTGLGAVALSVPFVDDNVTLALLMLVGGLALLALFLWRALRKSKPRREEFEDLRERCLKGEQQEKQLLDLAMTDEVESFINEFGMRVSIYMDVATTYPERLEKVAANYTKPIFGGPDQPNRDW